jgi:nitroreductase
VIQRETALNELIRLAEREFSQMEVQPDTYKSLAGSIAASKKGGYVFTLHAKTLIVAANKKGYGNAMADCSCALQNMMLAAASIGVGACWINQLRWLRENAAVVSYLNSLGFGEDEIVCGSLALGYPAEKIPPPLPRSGNPVSYIR